MQIENTEEKVTVLYPGGFKPPTGAHIYLAKKYIEHPNVSFVKIIISPKSRQIITQEQSFIINKILTKNYDNIIIEKSKYPSPVLTAYKYLENVTGNHNYTLASSKKGDDYERVKLFIADHQPGKKYYNNLSPGIKVVHLPIDVSPLLYINRTDDNNNTPISGTIARLDLKNDDFENFKTNYPYNDKEDIQKIWNIAKQ